MHRLLGGGGVVTLNEQPYAGVQLGHSGKGKIMGTVQRSEVARGGVGDEFYGGWKTEEFYGSENTVPYNRGYTSLCTCVLTQCTIVRANPNSLRTPMGMLVMGKALHVWGRVYLGTLCTFLPILMRT